MSYFFLSIDNEAMRRNAAPVKFELPVRIHITPATSAAGKKKTNAPIIQMIIDPIITINNSPQKMFNGLTGL